MTADENGPDDGSESFIDRLRRESARSAAGAGHTATAASAVASELSSVEGADELDGALGAGSGLGLADSSGTGLDTGSEGESDEGPVAEPEPGRRMPAEARRALVSLMRQGVVLAPRKARVFEALVRHEAAIRAHLAELYLELVLDEPAGVAFIRSRPAGAPDGGADDGTDDADEDADESADGATLISRRTLPLYDTLLLLILRKHYQERQTSGERRVVIDIERVESALVPFLPLTVSEKSDRRKLNAAMTRLVDKRLLSRVRGDDERFEITPVIRYVVDAAFLDALLVEYERLAGGSVEAGDSPDDEIVPSEGEPYGGAAANGGRT